jgi:predicted phosphodiesterase
MKLGVVGDLSNNDPYRLGKVLHAALDACDLVVQVGDLSNGYELIKEGVAGGKLLVVPGNHDLEWDAKLALPRSWYRELPEVVLVGLDNSNDRFTDQDRAWLTLAEQTAEHKPIFVFAHKSPIELVLPDGSISQHIMGEGATNMDAVALDSWLHRQHARATMICGHYHGFTWQNNHAFDLICEGRGGAAPELAYSLIIISAKGTWVHHSVPVA